MPTLIKNGALVDDRRQVLNEATGPEVLRIVGGKNFIVPLKFWQMFRPEIEEFGADISIWLNSDENVDAIAEEIHSFPMIALNFPVFSDGRSYTNARELREKFNYLGEIRAIGDVLRDQLYYMSRCGFDAFSLRFDQDADACLEAFKDFKTNYQGTVAEPAPLFRRR